VIKKATVSLVDSARPLFALGIDPGLSGALCLLRISGFTIESLLDMPVTDGKVDPAKLAAIIDQCSFQAGRRIHAAIEQVGSRPHQAKAFSFGTGFGMILGVLGALGVSYSLLQPAQWKSACGLRREADESQANTKTRARELASRLWPEHAVEFAKVKFDGRAEASLIARFFCVKNGWVV
jgi:crossover junction endodeoxyribonuclease RuvC